MNALEFEKKGHRYLLDGKPVTGVTTVLGVIAKPMLISWAAKETARWIRENCGKGIERTQKGNSPIDVYLVADSDLLIAENAHTKKKEAGGEKGTTLHSEVEKYIKDCIEIGHLAVLTDEQDKSNGLVKFADWAVANNVTFLESEQQVYSRIWWTAGTFDFSFEKDGKRFIGDLKTAGKIWDRVPHFQAAAYRKMSVEMGQPDYDGTCIVNISKATEKYPSELTESWSFDWESDQKGFEAALTLYRQLNRQLNQ